MNKEYFFIDESQDIKITWDELLVSLNDKTEFSPYCFVKSYYEIFEILILTLIYREHLVMLDSDFSEDELDKLFGSDFQKLMTKRRINKKLLIFSKTELISTIIKNFQYSQLTLFSSGTTGIPKKIIHTFSNLSRNVKISEYHKNDIWGFAYNPTHIAGIQVFLQAICNGNTIIRLFGLSNSQIFEQILKYSITHISSTTTFFRLILGIGNSFTSVKRVTLGGERFQKSVTDELAIVFPNAKIRNIYASTEAGTILNSDGEYFYIDELDDKVIKIVDNELYIKRDFLGEIHGKVSDWYPTGDIVEYNSEKNRIRFIGRKDEIINVGGYKVNPEEIEDILKEIKGIKEARVFAIKNSVLGNIVGCNVVTDDSNLSEARIIEILRGKIQEFKIPRIVKFLDKIDLTRTGKLKRI